MAEHRNAHMQTVERGTVMQSAMAAKCNIALATAMLLLLLCFPHLMLLSFGFVAHFWRNTKCSTHTHTLTHSKPKSTTATATEIAAATATSSPAATFHCHQQPKRGTAI